MSSGLMEAVAGGVVAPGSPDPLALCEGPDGLRARVKPHADAMLSGEMSLAEFSSRLADCADIEVNNAYARAMDALAPAHAETKWARVPVGETCEWCVMLGSLGYYFHSARSAARGSHAKCNCLIVPSIGGRAPDIGGYDPDALYMRWIEGLKRECAENNCSQRKERERSVQKHRGNWVEVNPISAMLSLSFDFKGSCILGNGKKQYVSKSTDFQILLDVLNGYFRVMYIGQDRDDGDDGVRMLDGRIPPNGLPESELHFAIERFFL